MTQQNKWRPALDLWPRRDAYQALASLSTLLLFFSLVAAVSSRQAFGGPLGLFQQSTQQSRDTGSGLSNEKDARPLEAGKPIKGELAGGRKHSYRISLGADQFLKAIVEQQGIDVVAQVSGPDGKQILEIDSEGGLQGREEVSLVAEVAGDYQLVVLPTQNRASAGGYEIRIEEMRAATENDRALYEAHRLYEEAVKLRDAGKYDEALPLFERVIETRKRILGPDAPDLSAVIHDLAVFYYYKGDYPRAESLSNRALDIQEKTLGPEHPHVAASLNLLAVLNYNKGAYVKAESMSSRAVAIKEKELGPEHPKLAFYLRTLARIYHKKGSYEIAEPLYLRALAIREKTLELEQQLVAQSLNDLASLYYDKGASAKAESLNKRALTIQEKWLGPQHPNVAESLSNLANIYRDRKDYAQAEPLYLRALGIQEKTKGPQSPHIVRVLNNLALFYSAKGSTREAIAVQSRANAVTEFNLALNIATGSERQKLAFLAILPEQTYRTISLHLHSAPDDPVARNMAATLILQRKGRALDATSQNLNALRSRFNAEDQALLDRLTETRSQIARLVLGGPQRMTAEQHQARIKELEDQADKDEADISLRSGEYRAQSLPVTLEAVRAAIPPDSALIEFASYRPFNAKATKGEQAYGQPRYVVYILRQEGEIEWRELGEAKAIDMAITSLRKALRDPKRVDVKRLARAVDAKVFQPVRPLLGDMTRLLISPDGPLNLISFAALVDERGRYVVERYSISYLASGRDLLRLQVAGESKDGPLVVAAPDFGRRSPIEASHLEKQEEDASEGKVKAESARSAINEFYFPPLPNAEREGEALRELLPDATLLTKGQATKAALSQIRSPKLLHIATHSFFLGDKQLTSVGERGAQALSDDPERALQLLEQRGVRIDSPLLRSGLALAGVNEHKEDDNGILTALEVTGLNLWGTKLVALSACDTGVGEIKNGDGVHGLRRALVLAGAETQVMSLWAVSDKATRELMVAYYGRLKQGQGRGEALRRVQLEMLKNVNRRHPYYWASFIQSGEWANLEGKR
jgi:CHAT domain-containing protein